MPQKTVSFKSFIPRMISSSEKCIVAMKKSIKGIFDQMVNSIEKRRRKYEYNTLKISILGRYPKNGLIHFVEAYTRITTRLSKQRTGPTRAISLHFALIPQAQDANSRCGRLLHRVAPSRHQDILQNL